MAELFSLHNQLGCLCDEKVYKNALAARLDHVQTEVAIDVIFRDFHKTYFMDVLASKGAVFELKAVDALHPRHRAQLLNYLLLSDLRHGKLVNLRPGQIEHEFVNSSQSHSERIQFVVDDSGWTATKGFGAAEKHLVEQILRDWGTGLERSLYEEVLVHFLSTPENVPNKVAISLDGERIAEQNIALCAPDTAFKVTTFENNADNYRKNLNQFLEHTELRATHWINISRNQLTFKTLKPKP